ncbi:MAG: C1 family peptidase [Fidelibacterota bacterium]
MRNFRQKNLFIMVLFVFITNGFTRDMPQKMQVSEEYQKFFANKSLKKTRAIENNYGLIPGPQQLNTRSIKKLSKPINLPYIYDLRTLGILTPVKDQLSCDCCWSFATIALLESQVLEKYATNLDFSEQHLIMHNGYEPSPCVGGNAYFSSAMLIKGKSPVSEFSYPYLTNENTKYSIDQSMYKTSTVKFLPNDMNTIKTNIMENGPLYSTMYWSGAYYNGIDYTYAYPAKSIPNHAVLLVGWNDTLKTDVGKGAWIVKNSWGRDFGDMGYFYVSYQDSSMNSRVVHWDIRKKTRYNHFVNGYDDVGFVGNIGYGDGADYGMMRYTSTQDEKIYQIGTWALSGGAEINIEVYENFNNNRPENLITASKIHELDYAGYYTFELEDTISLDPGEDIFIKVKFETKNLKFPLPVEYYLENYSNPIIENDRFWISNKGDKWSRLSGMGCDLCINVIGIYKQKKIVVNTIDSLTIFEDTPTNYHLDRFLENEYSSYIYNSDNKNLLTASIVNDTIKIIPAENKFGKSQLELYHSNGNISYFDTLQIHVLPVSDPPTSKDTILNCIAGEKVILHKKVFPFKDVDNDSLNSILITSAPYAEFRNNNRELTQGEHVSDFNNFYFKTNLTDQEGQTYFFIYKVEDSQGEISDSTYTFTINVQRDSKPTLEIKLK